MAFVNVEQAKFWSDMAPTWIEFDDLFERVGGAPGRLAIDRLGLRGGERVLDVGCGTGTTALELALRVGPDGQVTGVDIAEEMLRGARARAERARAANVEFRVADVQVEDLGPATFDAAFSRFGVMFFADPAAGFANIRRALRPGGRLSFACWQSGLDNEWMLVPGMAAMSVMGTPPPMPGPDEPGPFALADPDRVRKILGEAGFEDVEVTPHADHVVAGEGEADLIATLSVKGGAVREALRDAHEELRSRVVAAVDQALRERIVDGELRLSRAVLLARAVNPGS